MRYVKVARADEVAPGGKLKAAAEDKTLLVTNVDGTYYAIDNRCPHMGGSLYDGELKGDTITCPRHKTVFNVKTGAVVTNGRIAFVRFNVTDTKAYPVKAEDGDLFVGLE